jgi:predicted SnoaL-like aldol condensation-catalyzing enzyme
MPAAVESEADKAQKAIVQNFGDLIDVGKADEAFEKYMSKDFVEHSYMARRMTNKDKPGYADVLPFFKNWMARRADEGNKKLVEELVVNDEMVTYNGRRGQDIFRVVSGKITDHWDTLHQKGE